MKKEELFNIIGEVDEQKVAAAGMAMNKKKSRPVWVKWGAMAACLCLVVGLFANSFIKPSTTQVPLSGGILAEVTEVIDNGSCEVVVTGEDSNFSNGDTLTIHYNSIQGNSNKANKQLEVGNIILYKWLIIGICHQESKYVRFLFRQTETLTF